MKARSSIRVSSKRSSTGSSQKPSDFHSAGSREVQSSAKTLGSSYERHRHKSIVLVVLWCAILVVLFLVCICIGRDDISVPDVFGILITNLFGGHGDYSAADTTIIMDIRLPVLVAAVLSGSALSLSGCTYQGIFRNPLVSPDLLGAAAGAAFGAALALLINFPSPIVQIFAFVGGFVAVIITYYGAKLIGRGGDQILLLVLTGLIVGTLFQSFVEFIKYIADPYSTLPDITYWLMGSLSKVTWDTIWVFLIPYVIGVIPLILLRWRLNALSFGDEEAASLGVNVSILRGIYIFCATLLTSAVVAIAGIVGWVGLIIPHLARFMFGPDNRLIMPMSLIIGACFMVVVGTCCRSILSSEIPLGILTSIVGAPFFFLILFKSHRSGRL